MIACIKSAIASSKLRTLSKRKNTDARSEAISEQLIEMRRRAPGAVFPAYNDPPPAEPPSCRRRRRLQKNLWPSSHQGKSKQFFMATVGTLGVEHRSNVRIMIEMEGCHLPVRFFGKNADVSREVTSHSHHGDISDILPEFLSSLNGRNLIRRWDGSQDFVCSAQFSALRILKETDHPVSVHFQSLSLV